jgi:regulator of sirC expression with transglutaminase-like and TPR domain
MTLESLSNEELYCCLSFLDARSLCRVACCSSRLKRLVLDTGNATTTTTTTEEEQESGGAAHPSYYADRLWQALCWWKIRPVTHDFYAQYKSRTRFDLEMYRYITDDPAQHVAAWPTLPSNVHLRQFPLLEHIATKGDLSLCLDDMKRRRNGGDPRASAPGGLTLLFESYLLQEIRRSMSMDETRLRPSVALENFSVIVSKLLFTEADLNDDAFYTMEFDISRQLDELADSVRSKIQLGESSDREVVRALAERLKECGFRGNTEDYYHSNNSSIRHVLRNKTGNPISLCILCHLILSRLDVESHVLAGFPQHVILAIADRRTFLDAFALGQQDPPFLDIQQCEELARRNSGRWNEEYIIPSTPNTVAHRVLNNLSTTLSQPRYLMARFALG